MNEHLNLSSEQRLALREVKVAIFDVDNTLVFADHPEFYQQYGRIVEKAIAIYFETDAAKAKEIADFYRQTYGGGEQALFRGNVQEHFPEVSQKPANTAILYDLLAEIKPQGHFQKQEELRTAILQLRALGIKVVAFTSSPDVLSRSVLVESGFDPEHDFDLFSAYSREVGPPKMISGKRAFEEIITRFQATPQEVIAIGDSLSHDVLPALEIGAMSCLLAEAPEGFKGIIAAKALQLISELETAAQYKKIESVVSYENERPQILAEFGEGDLVLTIAVGTHGNEIFAVRAAQEIINELQDQPLLRQGKIRFIASNIPALKAGQRFLEADLNRIYPGLGETSEDRIARQVVPLVTDSAFVVDLHTAPESPPFVVLGSRNKVRVKLAEQSGVDHIVLFESSGVSKAMVDIANCGIGVELGKHGDASSLETGKRVIRNYLQSFGFIAPIDEEVPTEPQYYEIIGKLNMATGLKIAKETTVNDFVPINASALQGVGNFSEDILYPVLVDPQRSYADVYCYLTKKVSKQQLLGENHE